MPCSEGAIKSSVMGYKLRPTNKFDKLSKRFFRRRSVGNILVVNIGQVRNIFRDRLPGVYECHKPIDYLAFIHASGRNLRQLIVIE